MNRHQRERVDLRQHCSKFFGGVYCLPLQRGCPARMHITALSLQLHAQPMSSKRIRATHGLHVKATIGIEPTLVARRGTSTCTSQSCKSSNLVEARENHVLKHTMDRCGDVHACLVHRWHAHVVRRARSHWVRRLLNVQTCAWLTARRVRHGGGAYVWRTAMRLRGPVPRRWEDGLAAARAAHDDID